MAKYRIVKRTSPSGYEYIVQKRLGPLYSFISVMLLGSRWFSHSSHPDFMSAKSKIDDMRKKDAPVTDSVEWECD